MPAKPSLRTELLFDLAFLAAAALLLGVVTVLLVSAVAPGIAHEVGNPLGAGGTYLEVLRRRGADPEVVAGLSRELERIDRIVRSLLDYARPQDEALGLVDTATVVRGAYVLLEAQGAL